MSTPAIIFTLWLFGAGTADSSGPVSIAMLSALSNEAAATAIAVTTFVLTTAASIGVSYVQLALGKKPTTPRVPE